MKKNLKKMIIIVMIVMTVTTLTLVSALAANPANTYSLPYWVECHPDDTQPNTHMFIFSAEPMTTFMTGSDQFITTTSEIHRYSSTDGGASWSDVQHSTSGISAPCDDVVAANYSVGDYDASQLYFTNPPDDSTITDQNPQVTFYYSGASQENIRIRTTYTGLDNSQTSWIITNATIVWDADNVHGSLPETGIPWGTGLNTCELQRYFLGAWVTADTLNLTFTYEQESYARIVGYNATVEDGSSFEVPPMLRIEKQNYADSVAFYVNGTYYTNFKSSYGVKSLYDLWTDNLKLGSNALTLVNERTNETIQTINLTITTGYIDTNGNYDNDSWDYDDPDTHTGGTGNLDGWDKLQNTQPEMPGEGATIIDWIIYIGKMIGYLFAMVTGVIIEFAKSVAGMLGSLFQMVSPIIAFVTLMFNSLPGPISVGLFALFTLSVVLAIFRMIRRG